jgi:saccharopine dehydrogenase-like NADP-dependent oxidoreductase
VAKIIVLGAGMVGRAMAIDLADEHEVTSADRDEAALRQLRDRHGIATVELDLTDRDRLRGAVADVDLVVGAAPGFLGFATLECVIEAGKNIVDISFCPEDPLELDEAARRSGVTALVDIGVAPGMSHVLLGYHDRSMRVESFECLVGGLPKDRSSPFEYKAPFSPIDVIEEYTRPARYVEDGRLVTRPALSDPESVEFDGVGTLEAFNTDGLRSLLSTMPHIPNMKEKTLRYPGHVRMIQTLQDSGFFEREPLDVGASRVSPLEFTSRLLVDAWHLGPEEAELTVMRVTVSGVEDGSRKTYVHHLHDEYDSATRTSSMARTTGYTCTAGAGLVLNKTFAEKGVFPPERVGAHPGCYERMRSYLSERNVVYRTIETAT